MTSSIYSKHRLLIACLVLFSACKSYFPVQEQSSLIKINASVASDSLVTGYYTPYKDSLDKIMKVPLAELENELTKKQPEGTLGNHLADILKIQAEQYSGIKVDVAILNYGGIRIPALSKGILRMEHAYFIMPFDNYIVLQTLTSRQLSDFCDSMAMKKGWPVSGLSFQIENNKAVNIKVGNTPLVMEQKYTVALNDYVANGGDGMTFLKAIPQQQTGVLFRDAIIEYWTAQNKAGKKISAALENRISYAK